MGRVHRVLVVSADRCEVHHRRVRALQAAQQRAFYVALWSPKRDLKSHRPATQGARTHRSWSDCVAIQLVPVRSSPMSSRYVTGTRPDRAPGAITMRPSDSPRARPPKPRRRHSHPKVQS